MTPWCFFSGYLVIYLATLSPFCQSWSHVDQVTSRLKTRTCSKVRAKDSTSGVFFSPCWFCWMLLYRKTQGHLMLLCQLFTDSVAKLYYLRHVDHVRSCYLQECSFDSEYSPVTSCLCLQNSEWNIIPSHLFIIFANIKISENCKFLCNNCVLFFVCYYTE